MSTLGEPPDETVTDEDLDGAADMEDVLEAEGPRGADGDLVVDDVGLEEVGANLDDPGAMEPLLPGGMDDPDGYDRPVATPGGEAAADTEGWDLAAAEREAPSTGEDDTAQSDDPDRALAGAPEFDDLGDDTQRA